MLMTCMKLKLTLFMFLMLLSTPLLLGISVGFAQTHERYVTVTLYPIADVSVMASSIDKNYGPDAWLYVARRVNEQNIVYLMFNLSSIPTSRITEASLQLYAHYVFDVHEVGVHQSFNNRWEESTLTYRQHLTISYNPVPTDTVTVTKPDWYEWKVAGPVISAINLADKRLTLILKEPDTVLHPSTHAYVRFVSKDHTGGGMPPYWPRLVITYEKSPSTVSITEIPEEITYGNSITVSGVLEPKHSDAPVFLTYVAPDLTVREQAVQAFRGVFTDTFTPDRVGVWSVAASWEGDPLYAEAASEPVLFTVKRASSILTLDMSPEAAFFGEPIEITGSLSPRQENATITITYSSPNNTSTSRTVTTAPDGRYRDVFIPDTTGVWSIASTWEGNANYEGSQSIPIQVKVEKLVSKITLTLTQHSLPVSFPLTVHGTSNLPNTPLTITYMHSESTVQHSVLTDSEGYFNDTFTPLMVGEWRVEAGFKGDDHRAPATSIPVTFTVKEIPTLTLHVTPSTATPSLEVTIGGTLDWKGTSAPITLEYAFIGNSEKIEYTPITTVNTTLAGEYTYLWAAPNRTGTYSLRAIAFADNPEQAIYSNEALLTVTTQPPATSLTLTISSKTVELGEETKVYGSIQPPKEGVEITLSYTNTQGQTIQSTVTTAPDGSFTDSQTFTNPDTWMLQASIKGTGITTSPLLFTVTEPETPLTPEEVPPKSKVTLSPLASLAVGIILGLTVASIGLTVYQRRGATTSTPPPTPADIQTLPPEQIAEKLRKTPATAIAEILDRTAPEKAVETLRVLADEDPKKAGNTLREIARKNPEKAVTILKELAGKIKMEIEE